MSRVVYRELQSSAKGYYSLLAIVTLLLLAGLSAAYYMEHNGHYVTGMNNQIVWGLPHVFAIFLIVAASGVLNVASIGTVFNKPEYKPLGRLSTWMALALLVGGLAILVLDLGRPDRLIIAMLYNNFSSIFAWNIYFYVGFMGLVAVYLWFQMEAKMNPYSKAIGTFAFVWRLALTTATGSIFGFLIAREAYDSAIMAPLFISMSLALGLAVFNIYLLIANHVGKLDLSHEMSRRLCRLTGIFVAAVMYFVIVQNATNLYAAEHTGVQYFILFNGGIYSELFWLGQILMGSILPMVLAFTTGGQTYGRLATVSFLVCAGSFIQLYLIIIAGQAWPLNMFPGKTISSTFYDGVIATYTPSFPEIMLGIGGFALSALLIIVGLKVLKLLPTTLGKTTTTV